MKPTVLFLFNSSDYAVQPWLDDGGYNVVSVDYDDTDHSDSHRQPTVGHTVFNIDLSLPHAYDSVINSLWALEMLQPSLVVSFAPCTDLAVSGAAHFKNKLMRDPQCQHKATNMAKLASTFGCAYMVENPISVLATMWRTPDHYWHPWFYANSCPEGDHPEFPEVIPPQDMYNKKSCLWVGNGFVVPTQNNLIPPETKEFPGHTQLGGKSARTKYIRSLTPRGFAQAVYEANKSVVRGSQQEQTSVILETNQQLELTL